MTIVFTDGRWPVVLRVTEVLAKAGFETSTDVRGLNGKYSVAVDMRERVAARRVIQAMELS